MDIRPQDMPELRAEILNWTETHGADFFEVCVRNNAQQVYVIGQDSETAGRWFATTDAARLATGDLYWVSREMTELCIAAARSMPAWELAVEDVPSPTGLIFFDDLADLRPELPATALSWGPCPAEAATAASIKGGTGIWVSAYTDVRGMPEFAGADSWTQRMPMPPLMYSGESIAAYGSRDEGDISFTSVEGELVASQDDQLLTERVGSLTLLKTAWLLMHQEIAATSEVIADRAVIKRLRRAGRPTDLAKTRVIELRHRSPGGDSAAERDFRHQWIVRGHWRQQWYPSRQVHRPVWIAPHMKGPEGAPLLGGEKVYSWER